MTSLLSWTDYERDMRLAMILVADGMMNMLGSSPRAKTAAEAFLGIELPEKISGFLANMAIDPWDRNEEFLDTIRIEDTHLNRTVRRAYTLLTDLKPIHEVSHQEERDESLAWVGYFISAVPTDSYGMGGDFSDVVQDPARPLPLLQRAGNAYLDLIEFVHRTVGAHPGWDGNAEMVIFNADDVSLLGDVDIRSVRNAMGPTGSKPIKSFKPSPSERDEDRAYASPVDAIEWLSGRRGFKCGRLDAAWVNEGLPETRSLAALGALAGMMFWLNGQTTDTMAEKLGWDVEQARAWTRGAGLDAFAAKCVAEAAGLDLKAYSKQIAKLQKKEN